MVFDNLDNLEMYIPVLPALRQIIDIMDHDDLYEKKNGHYETKNPKVSYNIMSYDTKSTDAPFEFHKKNTDVQIVLFGKELLSTSWRELKSISEPYNEKDDYCLVHDIEPISALEGIPGRFAIFFPGELHKAGVISGEVSHVKKVVFKVLD